MQALRISHMSEEQTENILKNHIGKVVTAVSRDLKIAEGKLIEINEAEFHDREGLNKFMVLKEIESKWKEQVLFDVTDIIIIRD